MTEATIGALVAGGPQARVGASALFSGALARLRLAGPRLLAIFAPIGALQAAGQIGFISLGASAPAMTSPLYFGYLAAVAAVGATGDAFVTRLMLAPAKPWWRPDGALAAGLVLMALESFTMNGLGIFSARFVQAPGDPAGTLLRAVAFVVGVVALAWALMKLTLWPISVLMGRPLSLAKAWSLTRRSVRGLILANVLIGIPALVVIGLAVAVFRPSVGGVRPTYTIIATLAAVAYSLASQAIAVTLYDLRVESKRSLADVFD